MLPLGADRPPALFWRVAAWSGGKEVALSNMQTLPLSNPD
jgi:hypothetical protein